MEGTKRPVNPAVQRTTVIAADTGRAGASDLSGRFFAPSAIAASPHRRYSRSRIVMKGIRMAAAEKDIRNVLAFSLADGQLGEDEQQFARQLARASGLTDDDLQQLIDDAGKGKSTLSISRDADDARETIGLLVQAAAADRTITSREQKLLLRIVAHIGLDETLLSEMLDAALQAGADDDARIDQMVEDIYGQFTQWDIAAREAHIDQLAAAGSHAVLPLLRLMESYRVPDGADDALEMKRVVADKLGQIGDPRAVYYLIQQVNIGHQEDEITNAALRCTAAGAVGRITGKDFSADEEGIEAIKEWWSSAGDERAAYDRLAL
jgi:uncharacterized tellurite resistance protein B-like protein